MMMNFRIFETQNKFILYKDRISDNKKNVGNKLRNKM